MVAARERQSWYERNSNLVKATAGTAAAITATLLIPGLVVFPLIEAVGFGAAGVGAGSYSQSSFRF